MCGFKEDGFAILQIKLPRKVRKLGNAKVIAVHSEVDRNSKVFAMVKGIAKVSGGFILWKT